MVVLIFVGPSELSGMEIVVKGLREAFSEDPIEWRITTDPQEFSATFRAYRVCSDTAAYPVNGDIEGVDLIWPPPSKFLKNPSMKAQVWQDIKAKIIPASKKRNLPGLFSLKLSDAQIVQVLTFVTNASTPFSLETETGETIQVMREEDFPAFSEDLCISYEDVASAFVAALVFGANRVNLRPTRSKSQGKDGAI